MMRAEAPRNQRRERHGLVRENARGQLIGGGPAKRAKPGEHLEEHHTQRPNVGVHIGPAAAKEFGGHVRHGAGTGTVRCQDGRLDDDLVRGGERPLHRKPEVQDLERPLGSIIRFEVLRSP